MTGAPWAVVLAGGDGQRVSALTRDDDGQAVPKQYFSFGGRAPMLRWALARARRIARALRVLVVVNEHHRVFWERELADIPLSLVIQPCNRGTAAGVLLALLEVQACGGAATPVVFLPADHYVADEDILHHALLTALRAARRHGQLALLLGMKPTETDQEYGWILPATGHRIARVSRFVEKPSVDTISQMLHGGAIINSFILAARTQALLDIFEQTLPDILRAFRRCTLASPAELALRRLYEDLPSIDLSRDVLERAAGSLLVVRVPPCGWSDLGTPDRLRLFLAQVDSPHPASSQTTLHPATAA
jgi:mannose-1-phosphate guanylyltransferase